MKGDSTSLKSIYIHVKKKDTQLKRDSCKAKKPPNLQFSQVKLQFLYIFFCLES